ncbi:hypothetical protein ABI59_22625 [Acidobacteria bacterium Mor1]|nr:hypothetical protein ABI59_22625 [Acidobacteria bacterium Mor1]
MKQACPHGNAPDASAPKPLGPVGRAVSTVLGALCVALATAGVYVPGLPTTIFLILAVALFGRGCPVLREKVLSWKIFQPFRPYLDRSKPMPVAARNSALALMWAAISISAATILISASIPDFVAAIIVVAGFFGTAAIFRAARPRETAPAMAPTRSPRAD